MFLLFLPTIISLFLITIVVIINNLKFDDRRKGMIFSIISVIWSLAIFTTSYLYMMPSLGMQSEPVVIPFTFQYLLICVISLCAVFIKSQSFRFLTAAGFLFMLSFMLYVLSLFSYGSGYDGAIMGMLFIMGPTALASFSVGLIIFLFTRRVLKTIY